MLKHMLVPLDGSELSEAALPWALKLLAPDGKITLLSVLDVPEFEMPLLYDAPMLYRPKDYPQIAADAERNVRSYLSKLAAEIATDYSVNVDYEFETGDSALGIIKQAKAQHVDAIVMSTHGRSGLSRWLMGSVTHKVLNAIPCPVFVIPGTQPIAGQEHSIVNVALPAAQ
jgi:nucleotide-binding universal stress UspA family protein